ncbi:MAG: 3'-5' exonuclease [Pseudomonadota bacterium]|nr:3'-5' exonuclease [Pseudomonadota bacterium]
MRWRTLPIIAFDTETTGLNPEDGHRVIEFAGVEMRLGPDGAVEKVIPHHYLFKPDDMLIPREASDVSGIRDEDVANAPLFKQHAEAIHRLLSRAITVAHNYPFDQRFLTAEFDRCGLKWCAPPAEIDTVDLSRRFFPEAKSHKLGELSARLEVALIGAHRATNDAEACGRCFSLLARRHDAPEDLAGLIDWADAVGEPPKGDVLVRAADGTVVFKGGELDGNAIEEHPDFLAWMLIARRRVEGRWEPTFPVDVRTWIARWLRVRGSGRAAQNMKGFGPNDWGIDLPLGAA